MEKPDFLRILEKGFWEDFPEVADGYFEIPTDLFVEKIDLKMTPLPDISFYRLVGNEVQLLRRAEEPFSPLTLSNYREVLVEGRDLRRIKEYAESRMLSLGRSNRLPIQERLALLRRSAFLVTEEIFD